MLHCSKQNLHKKGWPHFNFYIKIHITKDGHILNLTWMVEIFHFLKFQEFIKH